MRNLTQLLSEYKNDVQANEEALKEFMQAREYYHGNQLPPDVLSILAQRGQPASYENMYKMIVDKILGYKAQSIQEIKIAGRQAEDKDLANLLQDIVRVFSQDKNYDKEIMKRDFELILGLSVVELWIDKSKDGNGAQVSIKTLSAQSFVIDKYSSDFNAQDATRFHKLLYMDYEQAYALFGDRVHVKNKKISDNRVEIIESWYKEKEGWNRYIWQGDNQIIAYEVTPFLNKMHPFVVAKYYIDHKNRWYGIFRDIKPLQDFINFTENKIANMMGTLKAFYEESAVLDSEEFAANASKDNAIIKVRDNALKENKIHFVQHHADISALSNKVQEKRNMLKIISGLNDEALAMANNRQSGIAIAQRRDAGLMGLSAYIKRGDDMDRLIFEKVLDFVQHYFTQEQTFRIVDKKVGERYFKINQNPQNRIKIGEFDLILTTTPKMQGREERFAHWSEMLKTIANIRPDLVTDLLPLMLRDTDSPIVADIEELLAQKAQAAQAQAEAQAQVQAQNEQLLTLQAQSELAQTQALAEKYAAQKQILQEQAKSIAQERAARNLGLHLAQGNGAQKERVSRDFINDVKK